MNAYVSLARFYDSLTRDVPYGAIADYYEAIFKQSGILVKTILDTACGTGTLTCLLAERGFDMIGVDASPEMLAVAAEKSFDMANRPMFINQPLERLYGTVDAAVCSLDGMNYIKPDRIAEVLRRVRLFLEPGGIFIFDINTPSKLQGLDGEVFLDETEDVYCVWRASYDKKENACSYGMDIFAREGIKWKRCREEHIEYAYEPSELAMMLTTAGFADISIYGEMTFAKPSENEKRIFFTARKPK